MTMIVTLEEGKSHLRVDHDLDDNDITIKIMAASSAVLEYIGDAQYRFIDTGGEMLDFDTSTEQSELRALHRVRQATLVLLGDMYRYRDPQANDVVDPRFGYGYLPRAVTALLYSLRVPTIS